MTVATLINGALGANLKRVDAPSLSSTGTVVLPFTPGYALDGDRFSEFVYVQAGAGFAVGTAVVDGTVVVFDETFTAALTSGTAPKVGQFIGVIRFADTVAQSNGFWVQVCGQANVLAAASAAANVFLSTTTTAGRLASAAAAGTTMKLSGIVLVVANGASVGSVEATLNYPQVNAAN